MFECIKSYNIGLRTTLSWNDSFKFLERDIKKTGGQYAYLDGVHIREVKTHHLEKMCSIINSRGSAIIRASLFLGKLSNLKKYFENGMYFEKYKDYFT